MVWGPNAAFLGFTLGVLLLFCELIFPLKSVGSALGAVAAANGMYSLWTVYPARESVILLLLAAGCFVAEIYFPRRWAAAVTGVLLLVWAATRLVNETGVDWLLAIVCVATIGTASFVLAGAARQARTNKRQDVEA